MIIPRTHNYLVFTFFLLSFLLLFRLNPLSCIYPFNLLNRSTVAYASDEPFTGPANWGGTGLMEIPTARVMNEGSYRIGASKIDPYQHYYITVSPFKRFEINGRFTEVLGFAPGEGFSGSYGNFKDKSFNFKYKLVEEGRYSPALSIGIMDPFGTRVYSSQLIVASKQIYPFDFTLGFGNGRFGKTPLPAQKEGFKVEMFSDTKEWLKDSEFFWGIQFAPSEKFALMMEYSPIKYEKQTRDPAQMKYFQDPVPSQFNYGIRLKPFKWTDIDFTYQRGNQYGVNLSMAFDIGNPIIPIYDKPYVEKLQMKSDPLSDRITEALHASGFSNIGVKLEGNELWIEAQNGKYFYDTRALGVILKILYDLKPVRVDKVNIVLHDNGVPLIQFNTTFVDIYELYNEKISLREFLRLSEMRALDVTEYPDIKKRYKKLFDYGLKPDFKTFLNDPSGFFQYRFGVVGWASYNLWSGGSFIAEIDTYPINTISASQGTSSSRPVRSDIVPYLQQKFILGRLMYQQILNFDKGYYGRVAGGILETEYAGLDGELAKPILDGRLYVGLSGSVVRKRAVDEPFQLKSDDWKEYYNTCFLNARLNIPEIETSIEVNAGQFLAGDRGARITVSKFIKGVTLVAWYSFTDTSIFTDSMNRGYNDMGVGIKIPMRLFEGTDSRTVYNFFISPWTRDVAQDIDHSMTLFDFFGRNSKKYIDKDRVYMYK
ncbi:MAG: YjbH domain-containing protein [Proteobacteria bacterium]|nr:YjbH domain-containing protein [Pseudomonadota bacterium]